MNLKCLSIRTSISIETPATMCACWGQGLNMRVGLELLHTPSGFHKLQYLRSVIFLQVGGLYWFFRIVLCNYNLRPSFLPLRRLQIISLGQILVLVSSPLEPDQRLLFAISQALNTLGSALIAGGAWWVASNPSLSAGMTLGWKASYGLGRWWLGMFPSTHPE